MKAANSRIVLSIAAPLPLLLLFLLVAPSSAAGQTLEQGYDAFERGDSAEALDIWHTLAEQGNATAQLNLGQLYRLGKGVQQSNAEAVKWYIRAANNGSDIARYTLLKMHEEGRASKEEVDQVFASAEPTATSTITPAATPTTNSAVTPGPAPTAWLDGLDPDAYLIQIVAASKQESLRDFAEEHLAGIDPKPRVIHTLREGKDWYQLVVGPFSSRQAAQQAADSLSEAELANKPWLRTARSLQRTKVNERH